MGLIDFFYRRIFRENMEIENGDYWTAFFNRKLSLYKEEGILDIDNWQETRYYNKLLLLLKDVLKIKNFKNLEVLELGSGTGILSILMAKEGASVTLIDKNKNALLYSKIIVKELRKRGKFIGRVKIVKGDIYNIDQKGNFDIVHNPPTRSVLEKVVSGKDVKSSLNPKCKTFKEKKLGKRTITKTEAIRMMIDDPNLIRRPLFVAGERYLQGFDEKSVKELLVS